MTNCNVPDKVSNACIASDVHAIYIQVLSILQEEFPECAHNYTFLRKTFLKRYNPPETTQEELDRQFDAFQKLRNTPVFFEGILEMLPRLKALRWPRRFDDGSRGSTTSASSARRIHVHESEPPEKQRKMGESAAVKSASMEPICDTLILGAVTDGNSDVMHGIPEMKGFFDFMIRAEDVGASKPSSEIFEAAIGEAERIRAERSKDVNSADPSQRKLPTSSFLMIGDSFAKDVCGASKIGMRTCWIQSGGSLPDNENTLIRPDFISPSTTAFLEDAFLASTGILHNR